MCNTQKYIILCGMTVGTTSSTQVVTINFAPAVEWPNKTLNYVWGVKDMRGFLMWIRSSCKVGSQRRLSGKSEASPNNRGRLQSHGHRTAIPLW